jgi:hypothetical protein
MKISDLIRSSEEKTDGYSRALQAARVRAAYQRSYFAPALFSLIPVATDLIASMAVDAHWRLYYNDAWVARHTVEENASLSFTRSGICCAITKGARKRGDQGSPALEHRRRLRDQRRPAREGLPLPGDPPLPVKYGLESGETAETYFKQLPAALPARIAGRARTANGDSGSCRVTIRVRAELRVSTA